MKVRICVWGGGFLKTEAESELLYLVAFASKKANGLLCLCLRVDATDDEMLLRCW